ncbi:MAG: hypothetical protein U9Q97_04725 [Acidobacteriota bacterium]|nr:hypothetical protein [Acidobacteriota bacterium]
MNIWVTEENKLGSRHGYEAYSFEVPLDGLFTFHLWAAYERDPGYMDIRVNNTVVFQGMCQEDQRPYWRCGSVELARGFHRIEIKAGER